MEKKPQRFTEGQEIEHLAKDHKDLWYPAKILAILHGETRHENKKLLIQYQSLRNHTTGHFLSSYVDLVHIRPKPPSKPFDLFHLNQIVDAFVSNGWMKGKIIKIGGKLRYKVHFFNFKEEKILEFEVKDLRIHQDWCDGRWVIPQNQVWVDGNWVMFKDEGTNVKTCKELDFRSPDCTSGASRASSVVTPQTPSVVMYDMFEDEEAPSVSRYTGGVRNNRSTLEKVSASNAVISGLEIKKESDSVSSVEVSQPCKKGREGESTEVSVRSKECNVGGTSTNNKMESENIVTEYSKGVGFLMPPVQCQKELDIQPARQIKDLACGTGTNLLARNEASFPSPMSTSSNAFMINMATQQTPPEVMNNLGKDVFSMSRSIGGGAIEQSTSIEQIPPNALLPSQENLEPSHPASSTEISSPCRKERKGVEIDIPAHTEETSIIKNCRSSPLTDDKGRESEDRSVKTPFCNECASENTDVEYFGVVGLPTPRELALPTEQMNEPFIGTVTNLKARDKLDFRSPDCTSGTSRVTGMATPQTPSVVMYDMFEEALSVSRNTGGVMNNQSTLEKVSASNAVISSQEIMNESDSVSSVEVSQPCKKGRDGESTEVSMHSKECNVGRISSNNEMARKYIVAEYSEGIGFPMTAVQCQKELDVLPTEQDLASSTGTNLLAQNEASFRSAISTSRDALMTDMASPQTPSAFMCEMFEEDLFVSRNTGAVMNKLSPLENVSALNAVISGREIKKESDSISSVEVSQPCKKGREGQSIEVPMRLKKCNSGGTSSNNKMESEKIVAEYAEGIGFSMLPVQCQKELDVLPTQQIKDLAFSTGTNLLAQNEASFRSPISASRDAIMTDMTIPQIPSAVMDNWGKNVLSMSRSTDGGASEQSTPIEKISPNALLPSQKNLEQSDPASSTEASSPCKKGRKEVETEPAARTKETSIIQYCTSSPLTDDKGSESEDRSVKTPFCNECASENTDVEYFGVIGLPTPHELALPTEQMNEPFVGTVTNLKSRDESDFQSPDCTSGTSRVTGMATPQTPSMVMYDMFEEALSVSRNTGGVMNNQLTLEKVSASNAVISGQKIMKESDSVSSVEVSQPCKKGREGESIEVSMRSKECNVGGTRSNTKMASENIVNEYSEGIGFAMPPVERRKMLDALPTQQIKDLAFSTGTNPLVRNEASFRSPISSSRNALMIDMATPQTPSAVVDNLGKDVLSMSKSTGGGANEQSTPIEKISHNLLCSPKNLEPSDPISSTEVSSPCIKERKEVETDPPAHTKEISIIQSSPTTDDTGSESEDRSVRTPFYNESASEDTDAEYFEVIGLPAPHKQMKESLIGTTIPQLGVEGGSNETESGTEQSSGSSRSASNQMTTAKNQCTKTVDTEEASFTKKPSHLFTKTSPLWAVIEANEIFRFQLQTPHFRPLEKVNKELREGIALGNMLNFVNLWEGARNANLNDPRIKFENKIQALPYLEELGFNVEPIRSCLEELLIVKDSYDELNEKIITVKRESLNSRLDVLLEKKKIIHAERQRLEEIKKSRHGLDDDFVKVAVAPLMTGRGVVGDKWSNRILWLCALGSVVGLWMVGVERQAQNRERALRAAMESGGDAADGEE